MCECIYVYIYNPVFVSVAVSVCIAYEYIFNFEEITKERITSEQSATKMQINKKNPVRKKLH